MAYTFGAVPEIAFALPFNNLSFQLWEDTIPDQWAIDGSATGTRTAYDPGFDLTRAAKIADTGEIPSGVYNRLENVIDRPDYILNNQQIRASYCALSDLGGSAGAMLLSSNGFTAGASGAVFGLLGAYAVGIWQHGVNVFQTQIGSAGVNHSPRWTWRTRRRACSTSACEPVPRVRSRMTSMSSRATS